MNLPGFMIIKSNCLTYPLSEKLSFGMPLLYFGVLVQLLHSTCIECTSISSVSPILYFYHLSYSHRSLNSRSHTNIPICDPIVLHIDRNGISPKI